MTTDSLPEHIRKPHLRPIQPIPVVQDGKPVVVLRDPIMLSPQSMAVPAQMMQLIQMFQGNQTVEDLATIAKAPPEQLVQLIQNMDQLGLLWGPTFEELEQGVKDKIGEQGYFSINASQSLGGDEDSCRARLEGYFEETEDPELEGSVIGVVAPHLDYDRGWPNYAAAYYGCQAMDAPDRVVILGTNHFGIGDGVVMSEYGFESPLGVCPPDEAIVGKLVDRHGKALIVDQLDHMGEHSIELHLPWLQYCFGDIPVVAALIPDPLSPMLEDDDERTGTDAFVASLGAALEEAGGRTMFVASSDLSHVGPQFGEPVPVDDQRKFDVERHDREMMAKFIEGDADEFVEAMKWNSNSTRWCSIGNMSATLRLAKPGSIELIDYRQACDEKGTVMVTSAAMALMA